MPRRPPTTATTDTRPYTAGARPTTAYDHRQPPLTAYSGDYSVDEEDEDDDSEPEDVFAYLPPTTADQAATNALDAHHQLPPASPSSAYPFAHAQHPQPETPPSTGSYHGPDDPAKPYRMRRLDTAISEEVDQFLKGGPSADELERARTGLLSGLVMEGESSGGVAAGLARNTFLFGSPRPLETVKAELMAVTLGDLNAYLAARPEPRSTVLTLGPSPLGAASEKAVQVNA